MNGVGARATRTVMYVGGQQEAYHEVEAALGSQPGAYAIRWVRSGEAAPIQPVDLVPDVILLGEDQSGAECVHLIRRLLTRWPRAVILAMVSVKTMAGASRAVMAGARGFVALPLQREDLLTTIDLAMARDLAGREAAVQEAPAGRVVVFCAPRGGTGRTALATNTAVALRAAGDGGVALIDADFGSPAVDVALNLQGRYQIGDLLAHAPDLDHDLVNQVLAEHASGVQALLAPEPSEPFQPPSADDVQAIIAQLKRDHAWVLVDLGLPLDDLAFSFLDLADRIILNVVPELVALRNAHCMLESMESRGYARERIWLVASRSPAEGAISKVDIEARLHVPVVYQIPDDGPLVMYSLNRGVPAVMSHPRSALARAIRSFAQALVVDAGRADESVPQGGAEHGWLGRLLGRAEERTHETPGVPRPGLALEASRPANTEGGRLGRLDLSESLLLEACPYLGLPGEPSARFPYPCTANHCCSTESAVPVDPAYQSETCFGNNWAPCPRFMARLEAADDPNAPLPLRAGGDGCEEIIIHGGTSSPEKGADDLSGSFVLQSCPYLGLAGDDASRYPYPDPANCCHARDAVRAITPEYQAKACFAGDWASCPQFKAGLSDSFFLAPQDAAGPPLLAESEPSPDQGSETSPCLDTQPEVEAAFLAKSTGATNLPGDDTPPPAAPAEGCPFLGLRDDPTVRHSSPDMEHCCHAGKQPQPMQPSYQVNYCLSTHWPLCENWEEATSRPQPGRAPNHPDDGQSDFLREARQRRGNVLDDLDRLSALLRAPADEAAPRADPTPEAEPAPRFVAPSKPLPGEPIADRDAASFDRACPHLALRSHPDRWIPRPHVDNGCAVSGTPQPVADVYQAATCFSTRWAKCPRLGAVQPRRVPDHAMPEEVQPSRGRAAAEEPPRAAQGITARSVGSASAVQPAGAPVAGPAAAPMGAPGYTPAAVARPPMPCPYLGLVDDEEQCQPTPDDGNFCHTVFPAQAVGTRYQEYVCLSGDWQSCPRFLATVERHRSGGSGRQRGRSAADSAPGERPQRPEARPRPSQTHWLGREPVHRRVPVVFWVLLGVALIAIVLAVLKPWAPGPTWLASALG